MKKKNRTTKKGAMAFDVYALQKKAKFDHTK